ncbi:MAG: ABC transporter substrate-binding protein [Mycobacterium sp.]
MSEQDRVLSTVIRAQGATQPLIEGTIEPAGFSLAIQDVPVLIDGFRRMVRTLEFDVCEMSVTTYLAAREHGVAFTALPVFLMRGFHHGAIRYNTKSGISTPRDLEGRRVGVNRGYTVTTGVWARGILAGEYGVDLERVTWVLSGDEHVQTYLPPDNTEPARPGTDLAALLVEGEIDAVIGVDVEHPDVAPLIDDPEEAALTALRQRDFYPINHLTVVKDAVLRRHPEAASALFDAFAEAKRRYVDRLRAGEVSTAMDRRYARVLQATGADPLPYGVEPNRAMLEEIIGYALSQHILTSSVEVDEMFAPATAARIA